LVPGYTSGKNNGTCRKSHLHVKPFRHIQNPYVQNHSNEGFIIVENVIFTCSFHVPTILDDFFTEYLYLYEYVEDTNTGFNSTGERAPIDGVGEQI
jgi:hypothetical protein